ncbi:uncharacterized protein LOC142342840 isoform X2 [Convolutriloba macropyga]|uniref:uncharacterized protein LOC142342840 isoform X2 n=1 Tax=Convolutriloba macropyga TaxID=536237 RepID=UPI003F51BC50
MESEGTSNEPSIAEQVREKFRKSIREDAECFIPGEASKFLQRNDLLMRFYKHKKCDVSGASKMLERFLKWRKSFGMDSLSEESVTSTFYNSGAMYLKGLSREGNQILWIHIRKFIKNRDLEDGKRLYILLFEKILWDSVITNSQVCLVMDLVNAGTANLDLTFLRFAVNMLQNFYPDLPEVIIPFQMPFYFRATWAVIKTWLSPEELSIIKFCGPKEIERFMSLDDVPLHMGGNSRYLYDYSRVGIENPDHLFIRVPTPVDRFRNNAHRDSIRSTESNTSVKSKVIAMQKIIDEIEEPSTSAAIPTVPDSPIQKKARTFQLQYNPVTEETGIANSFENTTTSEKFSPLISMRRRHHSTNSTHVDPILSMADSSRTESFVNVTWDPTSPEGVTDASDQMRTESKETVTGQNTEIVVKSSPKTARAKQQQPQKHSAPGDPNLAVGKHVSIAPKTIDMMNIKQTSFIIRNHTRGSLAFKIQTTHPQLVFINPTTDYLRFSDSFVDIKVSTNLDPNATPPSTIKILVQTCPVLKPAGKEELFSKETVEMWNNSPDVDKHIVKLILKKVVKKAAEAKVRPQSKDLVDVQFELETISASLNEVSKQHERLIQISSEASKKNARLVSLAEENVNINSQICEMLRMLGIGLGFLIVLILLRIV